MDSQAILDTILAGLDLTGCDVQAYTLTAAPEALTQRVEHDIARGLRQPGDTERSVARLPHYDAMNTLKIDVSHKSPEAAVAQILRTL